MEFIYFSDEWNQEKVTRSNTNISRVDGESKNADSGTQQEKVYEKK